MRRIMLLLLLATPMRMALAQGHALPELMDERTVAAIDKGLKFLAAAQRSDGAWYSAGSMGSYPAAMTALAGQALLASGSTPESGPYSREVRKAMFYILRLAESSPDGLIAGPGGEGRTMYGHGFGMLFLAQCYGMEGGVGRASGGESSDVGKRIQVVLDKAVELTVKSQSDLGAQYKHAGGWIYTPTGKADEGSVTVTQLQALRACRNVGIKVPKATVERAVEYLRFCQNPDGGICYSAANRGESRPAISAAAVACFYAAGVYDRQGGASSKPGAGTEAEMVEKLVAFCKAKSFTGNDGFFFYTHLYMAEAMYQRGGKDWAEYYPKIRDRLLPTQSAEGSWAGDNVGTIYGTALATTILQQPYGYLPIAQK